MLSEMSPAHTTSCVTALLGGSRSCLLREQSGGSLEMGGEVGDCRSMGSTNEKALKILVQQSEHVLHQ